MENDEREEFAVDALDFRVAKITKALADDEFEVHYWETYSKSKNLTKRPYVPAYETAKMRKCIPSHQHKV